VKEVILARKSIEQPNEPGETSAESIHESRKVTGKVQKCSAKDPYLEYLWATEEREARP